MRVSEVYLYPMYGLCFIFLLGLQYELLQDRVVTCDDADGEDFTAAPISLATASYAKPVTLVIDGVGRVRRRLEDDAGLDFAWDIFVFLVFVTARVVCYAGTESGSGSTCGRLEFSRTLPLGTTRKP